MSILEGQYTFGFRHPDKVSVYRGADTGRLILSEVTADDLFYVLFSGLPQTLVSGHKTFEEAYRAAESLRPSEFHPVSQHVEIHACFRGWYFAECALWYGMISKLEMQL